MGICSARRKLTGVASVKTPDKCALISMSKPKESNIQALGLQPPGDKGLKLGSLKPKGMAHPYACIRLSGSPISS